MSIYQTVATTPQMDERIHELAALIEGTVTGVFRETPSGSMIFIYDMSPELAALCQEYFRNMVILQDLPTYDQSLSCHSKNLLSTL
jgi:hypothetical protein